MKKIIITTTIAALSLSGCSTMTKEQQASLGGVVGAIAGVVIGAVIGGNGSGAAIGAAAGALVGGGVTYAFANDPYTQAVSQQSTQWQKEVGAKTEIIKVSQVVEKGETVQQIESPKMVVSEEQMVFAEHLSPKVKNHLIAAKQASLKVGGLVQVICPASATQAVMDEINSTGVKYFKDNTLNAGYVVVMSKNNNPSVQL